MKKDVDVEFTCYKCDTVNNKTVTVSTDEDRLTLNLRKYRIEVECKKCETKNGVDVNI